MTITVSSTTKLVELNGVPARIWEGKTESGIPVHCYVTRIAVAAEGVDHSQFEAELQEQRKPSPDAEALPMKAAEAERDDALKTLGATLRSRDGSVDSLSTEILAHRETKAERDSLKARHDSLAASWDMLEAERDRLAGKYSDLADAIYEATLTDEGPHEALAGLVAERDRLREAEQKPNAACVDRCEIAQRMARQCERADRLQQERDVALKAAQINAENLPEVTEDLLSENKRLREALNDAESLIDYAELSIDEAVADGWVPPSHQEARPESDAGGTP